jgi:hypothetical protein
MELDPLSLDRLSRLTDPAFAGFPRTEDLTPRREGAKEKPEKGRVAD